MIKNRKSLRELLEKGPVLAPCVYDCMSAKMVERAGFEAMCLSGGELAMSYCGLPDIGLVTFEELYSVTDRITNMSPLPMIVDIDTGFGNELNLMRTCERILKAGAKAVHLEDQTFPKRCGHLRGKEVIPAKDYFSKIKAAAHVFKGTDCVLIARTDAYNTMGLEEAIYRNLGSLEAGADVAFTEGTETLEDIAEIGRRVDGWKMFGMAAGGASPELTYRQLTEMGYNLITLHYAAFGAIKGMHDFGVRVAQDKDDIWVANNCGEFGKPINLFKMFGLDEWLDLGKKFNDSINEAGEFGQDK